MEPFDFSQQQHDSPFNMALSTLERMNKLLNDVNEHTRKGKYVEWYMDLNQLYKELYYFVSKKKEDLLETEKQRNIINNIWNEIGIELNNLELTSTKMFDYQSIIETGLKRTKSNRLSGLINIFVGYLDEYEIQLRLMMGKYKLLMPDKSDPRFALGKGI
jgi:hypothetical protein